MLPAEGMCAAPGVSALKAFKPDRCGWTQEKKEAGSIGENCYLGEKGKGNLYVHNGSGSDCGECEKK